MRESPSESGKSEFKADSLMHSSKGSRLQCRLGRVTRGLRHAILDVRFDLASMLQRAGTRCQDARRESGVPPSTRNRCEAASIYVENRPTPDQAETLASQQFSESGRWRQWRRSVSRQCHDRPEESRAFSRLAHQLHIAGETVKILHRFHPPCGQRATNRSIGLIVARRSSRSPIRTVVDISSRA